MGWSPEKSVSAQFPTQNYTRFMLVLDEIAYYNVHKQALLCPKSRNFAVIIIH